MLYHIPNQVSLLHTCNRDVLKLQKTNSSLIAQKNASKSGFILFLYILFCFVLILASGFEVLRSELSIDS